MRYTLSIFEQLATDLPPLLPEAIQSDVTQALEQLRNNVHLTREEVEETMIGTCKKLWPYRRAFQEFLELEEGKLGEQFLLGKLIPEMKQRYRKFKEYGGTFRDLHSGSPASFFTPEERGALCAALIDVHRDVVSHTRQLVCSTEQRTYEERIVEFQVLLDDIEKRLDTLRRMAEDEGEHPDLAVEIRAQVRGFEHGLCLLGPRIEYAAVCNAASHFEGRKKEKAMHRR